MAVTPRNPLSKLYKVVIRNKRTVGPFIDWDLAGESTWATPKGANGRRVVVARKFAGYDTGVLTPGGHIIYLTPALRPWLAMLKPVKPPKKRKLTPRDPNYSL